MQFNDEKDYIMRMIKEMVRVLFSLMLGKQYVKVSPENENKFEVSGRKVDAYKEMIDQGKINMAENMLLENLDYESDEEVAAAILVYQYISQKEEKFLRENNYSQEEVLEGLKTLAEGAGHSEVWQIIE